MVSSAILKDKHYVDVVKHKWIYAIITLILVLPGLFAMGYSMYKYHTPLKVGIDFTGGTMLQYAFDKKLTNDDVSKIRGIFVANGVENPVIQVEKFDQGQTLQEGKHNKKFEIKDLVSVKTRYLETTKEGGSESSKINTALTKEFGEIELLQVNAIGPTLGQELFTNSIMAMILAFAAIIIYLTLRFQLDYAIFAFLSLLHDALFVVGMFSIFGILYNTQVDGLFITAVLTVIGFSVHDTIVVYDRIRENSRFFGKKMDFSDIVNASVNQTLARSIYTSVTTLLTLGALYFFGGETTKDFVLAMILGIIVGTYSSIFFASMLLAHYRGLKTAKRHA
ncbi:MAG: protein translocase subunit SecF [Eubacteriales bacterium]|nr:protein translocase subunit SecF [Eubacteriales bacterium]